MVKKSMSEDVFEVLRQELERESEEIRVRGVLEREK